ncbi:MAG: sulfatase [Planctomycetes bacterium]|nr:sulfatase [Planctomycetota bacterium]
MFRGAFGSFVIAWLAACAPSEPAPSSPGAPSGDLGSSTANAPGSRPRLVLPADTNLLFVSLDTTRADRLSCYGHSRPTTPNLDRLAAEGHRFVNAYTPMPTTLPSHASMFTSLHPLELGVLRNLQVVPSEANTLAERLKAAGFATGAFVGAVPLDAQFGLNQGFDVYQGPRKRPERRAAPVRKEAAKWLAEHASERFFCFVHFYDAHAPYDPPNDALGDAARAQVGAPAGAFATDPRVDCGFIKPPAELASDGLAATALAYEAEIAYADAELGLLLDELRASGVLARTLVVVTSDHGETLDELVATHGYAFDHGEFLHRRELNIPFVLRLPDASSPVAPGVHPEVVSTLDFLPTLLELLGAPCAPPFGGRSLSPLLVGGTIASAPMISRRHDMTEWIPPRFSGEEFSLIDGSWHFVESAHGHALFDFARDPFGAHDLSKQEPQRAETFSRALANWRKVRGRALWGEAKLSDDPDAKAALEELGY